MDEVFTTTKTLIEAVAYFQNPDNCISYLVARLWPNGITCPTCGSTSVGFIASRRMFQCRTRHAKAQFSVKLGTIFEDSPLGLDKWLPAMWLIASNRNGISSWELHRAVGVTQKTAWFMLHRIRLAMQDEHKGGKLGGEVEADESFIGGKARNMHKSKIAGIKIHDTRMLRLMEVLLHGGTQLNGWRSTDIHQTILTAFGLSATAYTLTQLRYDLRKLKAHGLLERIGRSYCYRLTDKGVKAALMFILFHKRVCGPLANSLFHHRTEETLKPASKVETAYYKADRAIQQVIDLLAA